jgi:serine O-acetyltransferase
MEISSLQESYKGDSDLFLPKSKLCFPDREEFKELHLLRQIFFPYYWNCEDIANNSSKLSAKLEQLHLAVYSGIVPYVGSQNDAHKATDELIDALPEIRELLKKDVEAAYRSDPAAKDYGEIIRCYPGFIAILIQRVAHVLYTLGIRGYPRELCELAHSLTGIDIHPGAKIGEYFFIDHGTGVVIGETAEIGSHVTLYQGVTLGVLHFLKESDGILKKGYKRHPTIGSNVVIGAGAKILGPVAVGNNCSIGANSWIEEDIPADTAVFIVEHPKLLRKEKKKK